MLGKRAMDEHRLLEVIEEVPADSIYYHTHIYFLRHAYTQQLYSNDFATWVVLYAQDRVLGERLGVFDPFDFSDIEQLRDEILRILADHLNHSTVPRCIVSEPFEFIRSHIIEIPLGLEVRTLCEFYDVLADVEVGAVYNHACVAHMRLQRTDWSKKSMTASWCWLGESPQMIRKVRRCYRSLGGCRHRSRRAYSVVASNLQPGYQCALARPDDYLSKIYQGGDLA